MHSALSNKLRQVARVVFAASLTLTLAGCTKAGPQEKAPQSQGKAEQSCPVREKTQLDSVDLFDGDPKELAYLVPDEIGTEKGIWNVSHIYDAKRQVTLRCKFSDGSVQDLHQVSPVTQCSYSRDKAGQLTASCK
jgi:hypothetical protein